MTTTYDIQPTRQLAQADLLLLIRDLLLCHLTRPRFPTDASTDTWAQLLTSAGLADGAAMALEMSRVLGELTDQGLEELAVYHAGLFEGRMSCPITETAYIRRDKGAIIADIAGFYKAFGFESADLGEKPDHLAVELEFVAVLLIMEAQARAEGNTEAAEVTAAALAGFLRDHIGDWILPFCQKLIEVSSLAVHQLCATLLGELFVTLAKSHAVGNLPTDATPIAEDPEGPYECGMAGAEQPVPLTANRQPLPAPDPLEK